MNVSPLLLDCLEGFVRKEEKKGGGRATQCECASKEDSIRVKSGGEKTGLVLRTSLCRYSVLRRGPRYLSLSLSSHLSSLKDLACHGGRESTSEEK